MAESDTPPTFQFEALRVVVDEYAAKVQGEEDEEDCVLSPLAQPFSPRRKVGHILGNLDSHESI